MTKEELARARRELVDKQREARDSEAALAAEQLKREEAARQLALTGKALEEEKAARLKAEEDAAAALESLRKIAKIKEEARGKVITLDGAVLFATGKSQLLPIAQRALGRVAVVLKQEADAGKRVVIEGHTDSRGSNVSNQRLSKRRAESVRNYLIGQGVDSANLGAVGKGESNPIADNGSPEGRANNRRVEIIIAKE